MEKLRLSVVAGEGSIFLVLGHNAGEYIFDAVSRYGTDCGLSDAIVAKLKCERKLLITADDFKRIYDAIMLWVQEEDADEGEKWIRENLPLSFRRIDSLVFT